MSNYSFDLSPRMNHSGIVQYTVEEFYNITRGSFNEFNMKGYNPPRTAVHILKEHKIPLDKERDLYKNIRKRSADPGPVTYAADHGQITTRYWHTPSGKFHTYKRHTFTEDAIKRSLKIPGPGTYMSTPKGGPPEKRKFELGKFE